MPAPAAAGGTNGTDLSYDGIPTVENAYAPEPGSVYQAASLPGYDAARAALDGGDYWGVCVFYDSLPEGVAAGKWQTQFPEDGELERWLISAEELQALENGTEWNEFYFGDLDAAQGLVIVIAGEEE